MEHKHVRPRDLEGPPLCIPHRTLMNWTSQGNHGKAQRQIRTGCGARRLGI